MSLHRLFQKPFFWFSIILLTALTIVLTACSKNTPEAVRQVTVSKVQITGAPPTQTPYIFKISDPGSITVRGRLLVIDPTTIGPGPNDPIYLVPLPTDQAVSGIPQFKVGTVPQADVDESSGDFVFTNIKPGQYAVVVITIGGAQIPVRYKDKANYTIFTLDTSQIDTTVDLGEVTLP